MASRFTPDRRRPVLSLREREHRQPLDVLERLDALGDELAQVLAGDRPVGADVDDVVALVADALEVVDDLGDHALGDVGLAQPDLVGDQEPQGGSSSSNIRSNAHSRSVAGSP